MKALGRNVASLGEWAAQPGGGENCVKGAKQAVRETKRTSGRLSGMKGDDTQAAGGTKRPGRGEQREGRKKGRRESRIPITLHRVSERLSSE